MLSHLVTDFTVSPRQLYAAFLFLINREAAGKVRNVGKLGWLVKFNGIFPWGENFTFIIKKKKE